MANGIRKVKTSDLELKDRLVSIQSYESYKGGVHSVFLPLLWLEMKTELSDMVWVKQVR
jgi:hypothetical protein